MAEIEDHLNVTIQQVAPELEIPVDEFDGKVVYGEKRRNMGKMFFLKNTYLYFSIHEIPL